MKTNKTSNASVWRVILFFTVLFIAVFFEVYQKAKKYEEKKNTVRERAELLNENVGRIPDSNYKPLEVKVK